MRRVAAELGAGTMTLYHYVRTKDELVALMDNAEFPHLAAIVPDDGIRTIWQQVEEASDGRFERGLARLLDGIALDLERRGVGPA